MTQLAERSAAATVAGAALAVLGVGWVDYATGVDLRVFPLYFLPILLVSLRLGRGVGLATATASAAVWAVSNHLAESANGRPVLALENLPVMGIAFGAIALLGAEQRRLLDRERAISRTDGLTGLLNGRGFYEAAAIETARSLRYRRPLTVAYLDLDDFKKTNDGFGHARGDAVLVDVAHALRRSCRSTDLVGRLGGDEFVVLLPETDLASAQVALAKLFARVPEAANRDGVRITASIGSVSFPEPPAAVETLVRAADTVMYSVKAAGKNALRCAAYGENQ